MKHPSAPDEGSFEKIEFAIENADNLFEHAPLQPLSRPSCFGKDEPICLVTLSFGRDGRQTRWINVHDPTGPLFSVITGESQQITPTTCLGNSYRDLIDLHSQHTELKSLGPDGTICNAQTRGLLKRRSVQVVEVLHIGKEANALEEVQAGLVRDPDEVQTTYSHNLWDILRPIIAEIPANRIQEETGYSRAQAYYLRSGKRCPAKKRIPALLACAAKFAREKLHDAGCDEVGEDDMQAVAIYTARANQAGEAR